MDIALRRLLAILETHGMPFVPENRIDSRKFRGCRLYQRRLDGRDTKGQAPQHEERSCAEAECA